MLLKIETSDWLKNAAINGLIRILNVAETPYEKKIQHLEIPLESIHNFEHAYFRYFVQTYGEFTSWKKIVEKETWLQQLEISTMTEKDLNILNDYIEMTKTKLTSNSYVNTYPLIPDLNIDIKQLANQLKKITLRKNQSIADIAQDIFQVCEQLLSLIQFLQQHQVKKYITARNVIYDIITHFWNSVSFLHVKANVKDMFITYREYFLEPLYEYLEDKKDEKSYTKYKYQCSTCENRIASIGKAFDLTWLTKTGVDSARKSSHYWNFQSDTIVCPVCNFLYSCVPAGFTYFKGKGLFINENSTLNTLYSVNNVTFDNVTRFEELEEKCYFRIVDTLSYAQAKKTDKEIENIQIVKLDTENTLRPYTFNTLSKERLDIIQKNKARLEKLIGVYVKIDKDYLNLYQEVTNRIYQNRHQFDLIYKLIALYVKGDMKSTHHIKQILLISNSSQKGGEKMHYKKIAEFQQHGLKLREAYKDNENKLSGISYRLLNAVKVKNENRFMDTLLNAYMYKSKQVPLDFIEALKDETKFQTIAYAFLLGLLGERFSEKENKGEDHNE